MFDYTVIGGKGFIGGEFVKYLKNKGKRVFVPLRNDPRLYKESLGVVIYCAGEGDCDNNYFNVLEANTIVLNDLLQKGNFTKLAYMSSTRLYMNQDISTENCDVTITEKDGRKLFNLTKLISEELCIKSNKSCLLVRPSNVYGVALNSPLFLPAITRKAILDERVDMYVSPNYSKDYISVKDVVKATILLLEADIDLPQKINIASGKNTSAREIADLLQDETGCNIVWHTPNSDCENFPVTDISKLRELIEFEPDNVLDQFKGMIREFKKALK